MLTTTTRDGFRLPVLDCEALERQAKKRTTSRLESDGGPTQASNMNTPARNPDDSRSQIFSSTGEPADIREQHYISAEGFSIANKNQNRTHYQKGEQSLLEIRLR